MEKKLIEKVYNFWVDYDNERDSTGIDYEDMKNTIINAIENKNKEDVETLLDWCRDAFNDNDEVDYDKNLEDIWDILNYYKNYVENYHKAQAMREMVETLLEDL